MHKVLHGVLLGEKLSSKIAKSTHRIPNVLDAVEIVLAIEQH